MQTILMSGNFLGRFRLELAFPFCNGGGPTKLHNSWIPLEFDGVLYVLRDFLPDKLALEEHDEKKQ